MMEWWKDGKEIEKCYQRMFSCLLWVGILLCIDIHRILVCSHIYGYTFHSLPNTRRYLKKVVYRTLEVSYKICRLKFGQYIVLNLFQFKLTSDCNVLTDFLRPTFHRNDIWNHGRLNINIYINIQPAMMEYWTCLILSHWFTSAWFLVIFHCKSFPTFTFMRSFFVRARLVTSTIFNQAFVYIWKKYEPWFKEMSSPPNFFLKQVYAPIFFEKKLFAPLISFENKSLPPYFFFEKKSSPPNFFRNKVFAPCQWSRPPGTFWPVPYYYENSHAQYCNFYCDL